MRIETPPRRRPELEPMLPLINVVFLLLVFFMVAGQLGEKPPVPLETPESARDRAAISQAPRLSLDAEGQLFLDEQPIEVERLREQAAGLGLGDRPRLHADRGVTAARLRPVLQALREAGFEAVELVTRRVRS